MPDARTRKSGLLDRTSALAAAANLPEFVSKLLSTLDPADALTFLRHDGLLTKVLGKRRRTDGDEAEAEEAE